MDSSRAIPDTQPIVLDDLASRAHTLRESYRSSLFHLGVWSLLGLSLVTVYDLHWMPRRAGTLAAALAGASTLQWVFLRMQMFRMPLSRALTLVAWLPFAVSLPLSMAIKSALPTLGGLWLFGLIALIAVLAYELHYRRAYRHLLNGELDAAYRRGQRALGWWPDGAPAHALLSAVDNHMQRFDDAHVHALRALGLAERDGSGYDQLAEVLDGRGERFAALEVYREGIKNTPKPNVLRFGMSLALWRSERFTEALTVLAEIDTLDLSLRYGHLVLELARLECALHCGDHTIAEQARLAMAEYADALETYRHFMELQPSTPLSERYWREFRRVEAKLTRGSESARETQ